MAVVDQRLSELVDMPFQLQHPSLVRELGLLNLEVLHFHQALEFPDPVVQGVGLEDQLVLLLLSELLLFGEVFFPDDQLVLEGFEFLGLLVQSQLDMGVLLLQFFEFVLRLGQFRLELQDLGLIKCRLVVQQVFGGL